MSSFSQAELLTPVLVRPSSSQTIEATKKGTERAELQQEKQQQSESGEGEHDGDADKASREIIVEQKKHKAVMKRTFALNVRGRSSAMRNTLGDMEVGKSGVLSAYLAERFEAKLFNALRDGETKIDYQSETKQIAILRAVWLYMAVNGGSIGNADGFAGSADAIQPIRVGEIEIAPKAIHEIFGDRMYAYMRYRATEIRDTIEDLIHTLNTVPDAPDGLKETLNLILAVATKRGLAGHPQYVAVGSEYAHGASAATRALILRSGADVLAGSSNVREEIASNVRRANGASGGK